MFPLHFNDKYLLVSISINSALTMLSKASLNVNAKTFSTEFATTSKYLNQNYAGYVPASILDYVLGTKDSLKNVTIEYLSPNDGHVVTLDNHKDFAKEALQKITDSEYLTTDHLNLRVIIVVDEEDVTILFISLDNSIRANVAGHALYKRINALCDLLRNVMTKDTVIFFSEAKRSSFDGSDVNVKTNEHTWSSIEAMICENLNLKYLGDAPNNETPLSFAIAAFATDNALSKIKKEIKRTIEPGVGVFGVEFVSGQIVWGIQLPLDFNRVGKENFGAKGMMSLVKLMEEFPTSIVIGDFNTVPGNEGPAIIAEVPDWLQLVCGGFPTFFGAYFDRAPKGKDEWISLFEQKQIEEIL